MRLLVGLDKRQGGEDALELARVLGGEGSSALLVTVLFTGPWPLEYELLTDPEAGEAEPLLTAARQKLAAMEVETRAYCGGSPAGVLTKLAEEDEFDAIVVGSPHRGTIGRVMVGSVANSLLNGAPTDVAVAPSGYAAAAHEPPRRIAVGYDGTPEAKLALRRAEAIAKRSNAAIEAMTVVRPPAAVPVMVAASYTPEYPPHPDRVINEATDSIDPVLAARGTRLDGDPAAELVRACEEGVDLLVVGSRGYGPMARVLLGSVSRPVVQRAACPVLVARRP